MIGLLLQGTICIVQESGTDERMSRLMALRPECRLTFTLWCIIPCVDKQKLCGWAVSPYTRLDSVCQGIMGRGGQPHRWVHGSHGQTAVHRRVPFSPAIAAMLEHVKLTSVSTEAEITVEELLTEFSSSHSQVKGQNSLWTRFSRYGTREDEGPTQRPNSKARCLQ